MRVGLGATGLGATCLCMLSLVGLVVIVARLVRSHVLAGGRVGPCGPLVGPALAAARRILRCVAPGVGGRVAERRRQTQDRLLSNRQHAPRVYFYGDEGFALWDGLEADMAADGLLPAVDSLNCGMDGATAADLAANAFAVVLRHNPETVVVHLGTGDYDAAWWGDEQVAETAAAHLADVVDDCYKFGTRDLRFLVMPDPPGRSPGQAAYMRALMGEMQRLASNNGWHNLRLEVLDVRRTLGTELTYLADGLTVAPESHPATADVLRAALSVKMDVQFCVY
jgi:hypothetical protein